MRARRRPLASDAPPGIWPRARQPAAVACAPPRGNAAFHLRRCLRRLGPATQVGRLPAMELGDRRVPLRRAGESCTPSRARCGVVGGRRPRRFSDLVSGVIRRGRRPWAELQDVPPALPPIREWSSNGSTCSPARGPGGPSPRYRGGSPIGIPKQSRVGSRADVSGHPPDVAQGSPPRALASQTLRAAAVPSAPERAQPAVAVLADACSDSGPAAARSPSPNPRSRRIIEPGWLAANTVNVCLELPYLILNP